MRKLKSNATLSDFIHLYKVIPRAICFSSVEAHLMMSMSTCKLASSTQSPPSNSTPFSKRRKWRNEEVGSVVDRISNLPDSILSHILSFLPTKDVVATGVLSKRWSLLWTSVPSLDFDDNGWHFKKSGMRFMNYVNRVLIEHNAGSIQKFRIKSVATDTFDLQPRIRKLLRSTFTCKTLVVLKLSGGKVTITVPSTACISNLNIIELDSVKYGDEESPSNLISATLALEILSIRRQEFDNDKDSPSWVIAENLWKDPRVVPRCLKSCLRTSLLLDFRESEIELGMLKYMLKNGKVLETVELHHTD
ncbi:OLC1v1028986C1 [Oldenlandia corymbosa var. corymbosa]|uniref:OLC1v1028986C1 n=1 Tax=Oldenlandia corymbosa var. corymbosa TaxID=529605 RepID=A0AAV1CD86_OLDCO|nr:OLC1v1028986C1 [Oldenlandia corymbosa var. corymbosa]